MRLYLNLSACVKFCEKLGRSPSTMSGVSGERGEGGVEMHIEWM